MTDVISTITEGWVLVMSTSLLNRIITQLWSAQHLLLYLHRVIPEVEHKLCPAFCWQAPPSSILPPKNEQPWTDYFRCQGERAHCANGVSDWLRCHTPQKGLVDCSKQHGTDEDIRHEGCVAFSHRWVDFATFCAQLNKPCGCEVLPFTDVTQPKLSVTPEG